ncbi:hypothetical protein GUJ93_ZPchr0010g7682 [Zizania palustris]|uniref:BHLH domain-containing protein n=1 Tax=Zizania palustris TaxID=103762 RepID=A0A8J6BNP5_ZIZPA|nr:hypothetical protein GUJ93_ZPchr0010g7682 [Zizania palustris]
MSSRSRSRARPSPGTVRITDEQIGDLVSKLQALLPEARLRSNDKHEHCDGAMAGLIISLTTSLIEQVPSASVLQETCNYIRSLHREVDDLSDRLTELLAAADVSTAQAAVIRSLLM